MHLLLKQKMIVNTLEQKKKKNRILRTERVYQQNQGEIVREFTCLITTSPRNKQSKET